MDGWRVAQNNGQLDAQTDKETITISQPGVLATLSKIIIINKILQYNQLQYASLSLTAVKPTKHVILKENETNKKNMFYVSQFLCNPVKNAKLIVLN